MKQFNGNTIITIVTVLNSHYRCVLLDIFIVLWNKFIHCFSPVLLDSPVPTASVRNHVSSFVTLSWVTRWEEVKTICGISEASGFGPEPWNRHSAGLLFVASPVLLVAFFSLYRSARQRRLAWKDPRGGKQWLMSAHKCLLISCGPLTPRQAGSCQTSPSL